MSSQDDLAIFILINGLKNSQIVLKETKEALLGIIKSANLHEHDFFEKLLHVLADYGEWMGMDAIARDFALPTAELKRILPKVKRGKPK
jgi:hypothetical protein